MPGKQPILFLSHGSPLTALGGDELNRTWAELTGRLTKPSAILVVSAHWNTRLPIVSGAAQPATMHDFGGFRPSCTPCSIRRRASRRWPSASSSN